MSQGICCDYCGDFLRSGAVKAGWHVLHGIRAPESTALHFCSWGCLADYGRERADGGAREGQ